MKRVLLRLSAAVLAFSCAALPVSSADGGLFPDEIISPEELHSLMNKGQAPVILDARGSDSYRDGHVPGAVLPLSEDYYRQEALFRDGLVRELPDVEKALAAGVQKYPKSTAIITYCNDHCEASTVLLFKLKKLGFTSVRVMKPGFQTWKEKGYPIR